MDLEELRNNQNAQLVLSDVSSGLTILAENVIGAVQEGTINPLDVEAFATFLGKMSDKIRENIKTQVLAEASKYPNREFVYQGITFVKGSKTTYKFSDVKLENLKKSVQAREKFLKSLTEPVADPETGELIEVPIKRVTDYVYIKHNTD